MRQLVVTGPKRLEWQEAPDPQLRSPTGALVRPIAAARCDLDGVFLHHRLPLAAARLAGALGLVDPMFFQTFGRPPFAYPFPYGHECVAQVVRVGEETRSVRAGDCVVVPFQISCGHCGCCAQGLTAHCATDRQGPVAAYGFGAPTGGWGGVICDLLYVPHADAMLLPIPAGVDPAALASAGDNLPDGYRTVAPHLATRPGAPVLVVGGRARSIGLYAAASAVALGSSRVDYVDSSTARLEIAARLGAHPIPLDRRGRAPVLPEDYPISVDASGTEKGLSFAIRSLGPGGVCTTVAFYLRNRTPVPLWRMMMRGNTLVTGLANVRAECPRSWNWCASAGSIRPG